MAIEPTSDFVRAEYNEAMKDYEYCPYCTTRLVLHSIPSYDDTNITEEFLECKECEKDLDISDWYETTKPNVNTIINRNTNEKIEISVNK